MSKISAFLLIVLTLNLGGLQLLMTGGRHMARHRAEKIHRMRHQETHRFQHLQMSLSEWQSLEIEETGQGVREFTRNGWKYDVFGIEVQGQSVDLLVIRDDLETHIDRWFKSGKRFMRNTLGQLPIYVFNFYYWTTPSEWSWLPAWAQVLGACSSFDWINLPLEVTSPPPW